MPYSLSSAPAATNRGPVAVPFLMILCLAILFLACIATIIEQCAGLHDALTGNLACFARGMLLFTAPLTVVYILAHVLVSRRNYAPRVGADQHLVIKPPAVTTAVVLARICVLLWTVPLAILATTLGRWRTNPGLRQGGSATYLVMSVAMCVIAEFSLVALNIAIETAARPWDLPRPDNKDDFTLRVSQLELSRGDTVDDLDSDSDYRGRHHRYASSIGSSIEKYNVIRPPSPVIGTAITAAAPNPGRIQDIIVAHTTEWSEKVGPEPYAPAAVPAAHLRRPTAGWGDQWNCGGSGDGGYGGGDCGGGILAPTVEGGHRCGPSPVGPRPMGTSICTMPMGRRTTVRSTREPRLATIRDAGEWEAEAGSRPVLGGPRQMSLRSGEGQESDEDIGMRVPGAFVV